jgi:cyanobactin maturation PatA/PatG family protease
MPFSSMSTMNDMVSSVHATNIAGIAGIKELWAETLGDPRVCIAILDGPVDRSHPSLASANLTNLDTLGSDSAAQGSATKHGTHVASVLLGQHDGPVLGIAPRCRGLIVPIFKEGPDNSLAPCSQLDLARAISQAVQEGAHIINISGGESSASGTANPILADAVRNCIAEGILIVAATGNEGCDCVHVPGALPAVLAVGAMDSQGEPLEFSNWGKSYQVQGILAPGENILGATPDGIVANSGTSYASMIVSGIAALLLSLQLKKGQMPDPHAVRAALVSSAVGCDDLPATDCRRLLAGRLNVKGVMSKIIQGRTLMADSTERPETVKTLTTTDADSGVAAGHTPGAQVRAAAVGKEDPKSSEDMQPAPVESAMADKAPENPSERGDVLPSHARASSCSCKSEVCTCAGSNPIQLVYALGQLGYDFSTEVRRDSIMQHMRQPANPYDHKQMLAYLDENPSDAAEITWTLNLDQTTIYAIEAYGPFATQISERLRQFLKQQLEEGVERISVPGRIVGSKRLFTGQVVPVIYPVLRGMYSWTTKALVKSFVGSATANAASKKSDRLNNFLLRIYHDLRNLGLTPRERALNYSATNAMLVSRVFEQALSETMELDTIESERSPICRPESDCWDVKLTFFDPEKVFERARRVYRFTVDVSDTVPLMVGDVRSWSVR